eukprot:TRINITY_DN47144_c0_g1_i1.p1 TRINITY_DN47144_c0_g1~~TRINITY_DN47144_c0_g1_i1.p1  ORF type:complete len:728 (-),score=117.75 TRINITY_DN47144_c0_g1_i1:250-2433(-)
MPAEATSTLMKAVGSSISASSIEDYIVGHAPDVIDLFALVLERSIIFIPLPVPLFPDYETAGTALMIARRRYFISLGVEGVGMCMIFGMGLIIIRNTLLRACSSSPKSAGTLEVYQRVESQSGEPHTAAHSFKKILQAVLNSRVFLAVVVLSQTAALLTVAMICVTSHTLNTAMGVGFEYWAVWVGLHFSGILIEVIVSVFKGDRLSPTSYPQKALLTAMPLLSEKYDTGKDIVLSATSLSKGEPVCAVLNILIVLASQMYFLSNSEVKGELLEAYCPILTTAVTPFDAPVEKDERPRMERASAFIKNEVILVLLKQATPARRAISLAEDLPQGLVSIYLAAKRKASWFCLMSLVVSLGRLALTTDTVAKGILVLGLPQLRKRRMLGIRSHNSKLAIGVTKELLSVAGEDFKYLSPEDYEVLVEMVANDDAKQLHSMAHNPHCLVILISAAALHASETEVESLLESLNIDITKAVDVPNFAAEICDCRCLMTLKKLGANLELKGEYGRTPMHYAAGRGHVDAIAQLQALGASVEIKDMSGKTPMHDAAVFGCVDCITKLQEFGAVVDPQDNYGATPLYWAARFGHPDCITELQELGAEVGTTDKYGKTPLHVAAGAGQVDCITALQELGAAVDATDNTGSTPLHDAARKGRVLCITKLKELLADVNAQDSKGNTPMHIARTSSNAENKLAVQKLQSLGARKSIKNVKGERPLKVVAQNPNQSSALWA